nr:immunoglobulin heavy chain junction region [Macaca mulatta]MOW79477.1 immunoglobulin heavy chain junction region [Macaca mulatta]MOW79652.1 immunoglobulin heavy chain junction region [Macaca mulatta]MOW80666.1 immunoglobulin heavy chain junction region [Macaca mulatta]MOW82346.1 immunoglobulin heavy chain junction region [Macaca mulatta]
CASAYSGSWNGWYFDIW